MADVPDPVPADVKSLPRIVRETGVYPIEAFEFVQIGLGLTVQRLHGSLAEPESCRHVTGKELCVGLRELALQRWGFLAGTVLKRWNVTSTLDFGKIVFAMVENGLLSKTERDSLDDFRQVFDFQDAFERGYRIEPKP